MISTIRLYHASGYNSRLRPRESVTFKLVNMTITDDLVETFLKCPTKCFLRSRGEAGTGKSRKPDPQDTVSPTETQPTPTARTLEDQKLMPLMPECKNLCLQNSAS